MNGGGARAIEGARVYVLEGDTSGPGRPSISLLTGAGGDAKDSIGYYAVSNQQGGFSIAGDYHCTPGHLVYLYARGGRSGSGDVNPAIGLMAFLGACPAAGDFDSATPFVFMNAATTVAAAYTIAENASDPIHLSFSDVPERPGAENAAELVHVATGRIGDAGGPEAGRRSWPGKINTLANILSACINSSGPDSLPCRALFANAQGSGDGQAAPNDTAAAAINIARRPFAHVGALYALQSPSDAPFQPALISAPNDFTIAVGSESSDDTGAATSHL